MKKTRTKKTQQPKNRPLKNNLEEIYHNISKAKKPNTKVKLLAVTKTRTKKIIQDAIKLGITCFGENKVQEAEKKFYNKPDNIELHLIGHLQKNKIKKAVKIFDVIETVDSLELAKKINFQAAQNNKKQRVYCQINIGNDPQKFGFNTLEALQSINKIKELKNIVLEGTMTILPYNLSEKENQQLYRETQIAHQKINKNCPTCKELSMGMSGDYITAIRCGATIVRIGTGLFGERQ